MVSPPDPAGTDPAGPDPARPAPAPPGRKQQGPFVAECTAGKYAWCRCGGSATYPYCDGTHRGSDVMPIKIVLEKPCTVVWCACGESGNKPFCDGSHACS